MNVRLTFLLPAVLALTALPTVAQTPDPKLASLLTQLDNASAKFKSARAEFSQDFYEAVVRETTNESGAVYFERSGGNTQMGLATIDAKTKSRTKVYEYKGGILRVFEVPSDQIRIVKPTSNSGQIETFLTLGFGGSGKDLSKAWNITDQGQETLMDGNTPVKVEKLDLVSRDPGLRNTFTHVTIWIDPTRAVSLKQVFETPSHDRRTTTYSHIKVNASIDRSTFDIKKGPKTTTVGP